MKRVPQDPFFYTYNHLRDALVPKGFYPSTVRVRHPHGLTLEQIKRLPELLERPVVLMDSDRDDTMIAVLADVDEDGFPLIAALRPVEMPLAKDVPLAAPSFAASMGNRRTTFASRCSRCRRESSIRT